MRCRNRRAVSRLRVPDGSEDLQHVGASDLRDRHLPDAREGVPLEGQDPLAAVRPISPAGLLLFYHTRGGFGEARYALPTTLLGKRVAALAGQLTVGQRLFPGLGEGDQRDAAEPELAAPAADDQALNPPEPPLAFLPYQGPSTTDGTASPFSRSSSFRRRAWLTFIPPYSRLHR